MVALTSFLKVQRELHARTISNHSFHFRGNEYDGNFEETLQLQRALNICSRCHKTPVHRD